LLWFSEVPPAVLVRFLKTDAASVLKTGFGKPVLARFWKKIIEQKSSRANAHANPRVANRAVRVPGWRALVLYGRKPSLYVNS
jgi:hypothetical protein